jgi:hypothetical protein
MQVIIWLPLLLLPGIATNTYAGQREAQQSQEKGLAAENGHLQAQLSALRRDLQKERQQLADAREDGTVPLGTISELHKQVEALQEKTERAGQTDPVSAQEVEVLRRENQRLQAEINIQIGNAGRE